MMLLNERPAREVIERVSSTSIFSTGPAPIISTWSRGSSSAKSSRRPERLDRQLLEVMLSHHPSGLAVVAAPNRPAEMRSFDPDMVTRLLDMVSSHFDHVVFDMPRTWFSWTDSVLLGSNKLFIVSELTVPGLRHAKQLVEAVRERLAGGAKPEVVINRFRSEDVLIRAAQIRRRAGAWRRVRSLHSERLWPGTRGHRSWRAARGGQTQGTRSRWSCRRLMSAAPACEGEQPQTRLAQEAQAGIREG